jgi:short-subunit dehydrogenase
MVFLLKDETERTNTSVMLLRILRSIPKDHYRRLSSVAGRFAVEGFSESIAYELELFGIKIFLVEPVAIRTNFFNGMVAGKKSQDPNPPYSQMMLNVARGFESILEGGSSADVVAKVVLNAVTTEILVLDI